PAAAPPRQPCSRHPSSAARMHRLRRLQQRPPPRLRARCGVRRIELSSLERVLSVAILTDPRHCKPRHPLDSFTFRNDCYTCNMDRVNTDKPRGRPRSFDRGRALERAMHVFWRQGYEATSVSDLTRAMHINPPSLYAAFGDKEQLYLEALARYQQRRVESMAK